MCGIAGTISQDHPEVFEADVRRMTEALAHRGPDGEGILVRSPVALGHRRLSIIDLAGGHQPLSNEDGTVWITYNGELYNYRELRELLIRSGHEFKTVSDTEVIVHSYEEWGEDCVTRFRGMFAFAVADYRRKLVFLARDQFGIKPLFYQSTNSRFGFASEINALRQMSGSHYRGSLWAVELFLRYQYIPAPYTIFSDIKKLPPGHRLTVGFDGACGVPNCYFSLPDSEPISDLKTDWEEETKAIIDDAVKAHLMSDVPFGVFLSGGIDSTLIAWSMSQKLGRRVPAFSIGFREEEVSELRYAEKAAKELDLDWHTEIVSSDQLDNLPLILAQYGEPFGDSSALPTWQVCRLAREHVPMVLSGDGGDEAFGGYNSYQTWMQHEPWQRLRDALGGAHAKSSFRALRDYFRFRRRGSDRYSLAQWLERVSYCDRERRRILWRPDHRALLDRHCEPFQRASSAAQASSRLEYAQRMDYATYLPSDILTKVDIAAMAHGLEVRVPLVDRNLAAHGLRLPLHVKFGIGQAGETVGKLVLKQLVARQFGEAFAFRRKQGFAIPLARWFVPGGRAHSLLSDELNDKSNAIHSLFDTRAIRLMLKESGNVRRRLGALWLILVLAVWLRDQKRVTFQ